MNWTTFLLACPPRRGKRRQAASRSSWSARSEARTNELDGGAAAVSWWRGGQAEDRPPQADTTSQHPVGPVPTGWRVPGADGATCAAPPAGCEAGAGRPAEGG